MKNLLTLLCIVCACIGFISCGCHDENISYQVFTRFDSKCSNYQGSYCSFIQDYTTGTAAALEGKLVIGYDKSADTCIIFTNGIPNHNVNDETNKFANTPAPVYRCFTITNSPTAAPGTPTPLGTNRYNAILLNGAIVDLIADGCCDEAKGGDIQAGCADPSASWRLDPMNEKAGFTKDKHNAHCQNDGTYHYHGPPIGVYKYPSTKVSPVIGFAADGFPIHGPYFEDNKGVIREARSSYRKAPPPRPSDGGVCPVGTERDGKYIQDYVYVAGFGDLDECNGMVFKGQYYYFVTHDYPYIMKCFMGTPNPTFDHSP